MSGPKSVLQRKREALGKSRQTAADGVGVDVSTWKRWELGMLSPSARNLLDIAAYLGCKAEELREITVPRRRSPAVNGRGPLAGGTIP